MFPKNQKKCRLSETGSAAHKTAPVLFLKIVLFLEFLTFYFLLCEHVGCLGCQIIITLGEI